MKKTAAVCTALRAFACSISALAASSDGVMDKLNIPTATKTIVAEPAEKGTPASEKQQKKSEKVTSMDLVLILDKSGSMYGLEKDTIGGFNSMLDKQRKADLKVNVTAVMFKIGRAHV